jgi:hypothetical protein
MASMSMNTINIQLRNEDVRDKALKEDPYSDRDKINTYYSPHSSA